MSKIESTGRSSTMRRTAERVFQGVIAGLLLCALAGCESTASLNSDTAEGKSPAMALAPPKPAAPQQAQQRIAFAPIIGAPDAVGKRLSQDLVDAANQKAIKVAAGVDKPDFTMRGYVVAARDRAGTKISYIFDLTDISGVRVNRITGEEIASGPAPADVWAAVSPQVSSAIAQKAALSLQEWLSAQGAKVATSSITPPSAPAQPAMSVSPASAVGAGQGNGAAPAGSPLMLAVPTLTGAPGDGNAALARALKTELSRNGVTAADGAANAYRVEGVVKLGQAADGKQPIQIDWNVKDPQGKPLGTVTQKNEVGAGTLNSSWGKTADAAAAAATQGILKLLPQRSASN